MEKITKRQIKQWAKENEIQSVVKDEHDWTEADELKFQREMAQTDKVLKEHQALMKEYESTNESFLKSFFRWDTILILFLCYIVLF